MPKVKAKPLNSDKTMHSRPGATEEARENQLIAKSMNLAEKQLEEGTASSQIIVHFLKLGTEKAKLERIKLEHENKLLEAKTEAIKSSKRSEELFEKALRALGSYRGEDSYEEENDYEEY